MRVQFDHEKLRVYKQAIEFVVWCNGMLEKVPKKYASMINLIELQLLSH